MLTADFEVGDTIEKGTVLYTIDSSDIATSVEKAQLALEQAQRSYDDTADAQYIRSVIGGTVASIKVKAGDYVTAGQEIATVRDDSSLLLTLEFPAADASGFAVGQAAEVILNGTFETLSGTVQAVAGTDTISSGNLLVRTVTIAVKNNGSLTTAQAASATINGVSALASARFDYQHQQTVTATTSGTVAAVCVKEGTAIEANTAIVQLSGTELSRQVQSAADSLLNAQLSMSDTEKQMENYTITSPISGTVIQKNVKAGDTVGTDTTASETLCTIYDLSYLEMTLNVDELEILSIKEGQTVTITADAISDRTFTGVVASVSAAGTTTGGTTTYPVTIRIDDTGDLLPGMNATAEIEVSSASNALAVPNGSVVRGNYVLVTKDSPSAANAVQDMTAPDGYVYVKITTGTSDNDSIEVTGGLQEGDTIAYDANAAEKQNASDSMEFMVGPGGTIAYDADAAEKQNATRQRRARRRGRRPRRRRPGRRLLMSALIEFDHVCKYYQMGDTLVKAADHISMQINKGEFVAIVGQSGSGKSTCMNIIGCLDVPTAGTYKLNGRDVGRMSRDELAEIRNELLGFIFQQYNLLPKLSLIENVGVPLVYAGVPRGERRRRAAAALERVGLGDKLRNKPNQLSGGQQQRVSIARALAGRPAVILADEPTGALDSHTGREVLGMLQELHRQGNTVVLITHDNSIAVQAQRIIRLEDGHVVYDGDAHAPEAVVQPNYAPKAEQEGSAS